MENAHNGDSLRPRQRGVLKKPALKKVPVQSKLIPMKQKLIFSLILLIFQTQAWAEGPFGIGLILGDPTGLSGKVYLNEDRAIDAALAWSTGSHKSLHLHGDYLFHKPNVFQVDHHPINLYYGIGARLISWDDHHPDHNEDDKISFGPRGPVGLNFNFKDPAIEVFTELALVFEVIPGTDVDIDFGIGGRFYF